LQAEQKKVQSTAVDFSQLSLELSTRSAAAVSDIFFIFVLIFYLVERKQSTSANILRSPQENTTCTDLQ
jgi:hypothetical protein